jgi:hypothetical protein
MPFRACSTSRIASLSALLTLLNFIPGNAASDPNDEKPKKAFVKIFNAVYRDGAEKWETGLNLKFHDEPLANDVRVGEGGLVRQISYQRKDTVDVFRNREFLKNPASANNLPAAKLSTTFDEGSATLLVVHGEITPHGEKLNIEAIREFPVNEESRRPGMARLLLANFRQGEPVFLSIGTMDTFQLHHNEKREIFLPPGESEIFLIHRQNSKSDYKRQLTAFHFKGDHNYTGLISPSSEIPTRPSLRISDSNQDWLGIRSSKEKNSE